MTRILSIQSHVVAGAVGHGASVPALTLLGHEVWPVPTVVLSGHAATPGVTGRRLPGAEVADLLEGLAAAGALDRVGAVLLGYLGSVEVGEVVGRFLHDFRATRPGVPVLCDPVLGDQGRLYLPEAMVEIYRARILPLADVATPNRDELGWLAKGRPEDLARLGPGRVFVTSWDSETACGIAACALPAPVHVALAARVPGVFHGAGDFTAAVLLDAHLSGLSATEAAERAVRSSAALAKAAADVGDDVFPVVAARSRWCEV